MPLHGPQNGILSGHQILRRQYFRAHYESVRDRNVYLVQPIATNPNDEFVEILFFVDALKRSNALSVTLVMPYFGYAKGDKKDEPRVSIRARGVRRIHGAGRCDRFITMDLHSPQVQGFFKRPMDHLYAMPMAVRNGEKGVGFVQRGGGFPGCRVRQASP